MAATVLIIFAAALIGAGGMYGYHSGYDRGFEDAINVFEAEIEELKTINQEV